MIYKGQALKQYKNRGRPPYYILLTKTYVCWWYSAGNHKSTEGIISGNYGGMHSDNNQKRQLPWWICIHKVILMCIEDGHMANVTHEHEWDVIKADAHLVVKMKQPEKKEKMEKEKKRERNKESEGKW